MRALTRLNQAGNMLQASQQQSRGRPDEMPLIKIMRDPQNPRQPLNQRTPDEQQRQRELNANIKKRGVKSPISLRPHPTIHDMWIINAGHCRYDGAEAADLPTIPYFIDPNFDSYDQIAENLHRADLSPWSIAEFIKRKLEQKQSKGQIAEGIGKESESFITEHLALVDAPKCLHSAYANEVRSTRTLYDLRRAYEEFPEQVERWCDSGAKITRPTIQAMLQQLRNEQNQSVAAIAPTLERVPAMSGFRHDEETHPVDPDRGEPEIELEKAAPLDLPHLSDMPDVHHTTATTSTSLPAITSSEFRHDEKRPTVYKQKASRSDLLGPRRSTGEIPVLYRKRRAFIAADTKVKIFFVGEDEPLEVYLAELVFKETP